MKKVQKMVSIVDRLERERPLFHDDCNGNRISWNPSMNLLRLVEEHLTPEMHTVETGAGYSTIVFLYKRCFHTCIVSSEDEVNRIKHYCESVGISLDRVKFMVGQSPDLLPTHSK